MAAANVLVPCAAGSANDLLARVFAEAVSKSSSMRLVTENRARGAGSIPSQAVAGARPGGYTLLSSGIASLVLGSAMDQNNGFDAMKDFTHIAYLGGPPSVLIVNPSLGIKSYGEFLSFARS